MAAPTLSPRSTPTGIKIDDGFSTKIGMSGFPTISLWEVTVQPPGIDGGDKIETTTMHNVAYRTMAPRALKTLTDVTSTCQYDPGVITTILAAINQRNSITVHFPDGSTLTFFGYLQKFEPGENKEGDPPTATVTIVVTNYDPVNKVEAAPVLVSVAGT